MAVCSYMPLRDKNWMIRIFCAVLHLQHPQSPFLNVKRPCYFVIYTHHHSCQFCCCGRIPWVVKSGSLCHSFSLSCKVWCFVNISRLKSTFSMQSSTVRSRTVCRKFIALGPAKNISLRACLKRWQIFWTNILRRPQTSKYFGQISCTTPDEPASQLKSRNSPMQVIMM